MAAAGNVTDLSTYDLSNVGKLTFSFQPVAGEGAKSDRPEADTVNVKDRVDSHR